MMEEGNVDAAFGAHVHLNVHVGLVTNLVVLTLVIK